MSRAKDTNPAPAPRAERRRALGAASHLAMLAGLVGSYGLFAHIAGRFLYPARPRDRRWVYVSRVDDVSPGQALRFRTSAGETINVTRQGAGADAGSFVALSSTCPHLGCQVFWEPQNDRYFCPCHNGTFDRAGKGTGGPPGDAGQSLLRYELRVDGGLLYIAVPDSAFAKNDDEGRLMPDEPGIHGPGHDPCLSRRRA